MKKNTDFQKLIPAKYEVRWQKEWREKRIYQPDLNKIRKPFNKAQGKPFYNLMMFPYPSAEGLHVGNVYAFTGADIYGRFMRMRVYDVFEPIGLDGFGIHSENFAIKAGKHPYKQAKISEKNFYRQLRSIGNGFAWENRLETYDPNYYKWTQWIFVKMFKAGLAVRKKSSVNFCPSCKTVLSDEQVIQGACERCSTQVNKKDLPQWFFKITDYSEKLLDGLGKIDWSKKVKIAQRNWIGKKEGINIDYRVVDSEGNPLTTHNPQPTTIACFTTRPDTNFGATFVVVAPEHPFVVSLLNSKFKIQNSKFKEIRDYVEAAKKKSDMERIAEGREKTGVFTGFYCINDLTGRKMPIFISDFVLMEVGSGAVVGVPAHDRRDYEFARKFNLDIKVVVLPDKNSKFKIQNAKLQFKIQNSWVGGAYEGEGIVINSLFLDGLTTEAAKEKIVDYLENKDWGKRMTTYRLRDWCISRQRYWGPPIPMIYCGKCAHEGKSWFSGKEAASYLRKIKNQSASWRTKIKNKIGNWKLEIGNSAHEMRGWYPVPEEDLPVELPYIKNYQPKGTDESPLTQDKEFVKVKCPHCGADARRETDVSDTFLDSAWYFLRYPSVNKEQRTENREQKSDKDTSEVNPPTGGDSSDGGDIGKALPWDRKITRKWLPVNMYIGGAEHSVLHLLYSRFLCCVLYDMGYLHFEEPFTRFYAHGLIIAEGAKMSKSKGNIIVPDEYIKKYGADTLRTYLMFLGPFNQGGDFRDTGIAGMYRFLSRVWRLVVSYQQSVISGQKPKTDNRQLITDNRQLTTVMHQTIKEVTEDLENLRYNTAIAHIMTYVNHLTDNRQLITDNHIKSLLLMLAPFAPHMTEELWQQLRKGTVPESPFSYNSIHLHPFPTYDSKYLKQEEVTIVVQVNGKKRDAIKIKSSKLKVKSYVEKEARRSNKAQKYLQGKKIKKVIFVPGRLINFVT